MEKMFESTLWASRFMVIMAVVFGLIGAVILFIVASVDIYDSAKFVVTTYINYTHPEPA